MSKIPIITPKQKAVSLGFTRGSQVIFKGKIHKIVRHGGGSVSNPRVYVINNRGKFSYRSIKNLILINKTQKFKVGDKVKYEYKDHENFEYGEGIIVSSCHNRLTIEERMIVMNENEEVLCIPERNMELISRNNFIVSLKSFESKFIPGDIINYENKILYVVSIFKCLLTGFNFLLLSNGDYCFESYVKMVDNCVYQ